MTVARRQLLTADEVAKLKLRMSRRTFDRHREGLELIGFPKPALAADRFGVHKWDEAAIDAWFDSLMKPELKQIHAARHSAPDPDIRSRLQQSAKEIFQ